MRERRMETLTRCEGAQCAEKACIYCNKVETRKKVCKERVFRRIIFDETGTVNWKKV